MPDSKVEAAAEKLADVVEEKREAEAAAGNESERLDESPEGGRFVVGGQLVDANGEPVKGRKA